MTTGALPATVLTGYFQTYGFQALVNKLRNAAALSVHACWLVFPALLPPAVALAWRKRDRDVAFLAAWIGLFFAGALAVFFAGSARYLLPMAAPVALLASRLPRRVAGGGVCRADGARPRPRRGELAALGRLPAVRRDPRAAGGPPPRVDQRRVGAALLPGSERRAGAGEGPRDFTPATWW